MAVGLTIDVVIYIVLINAYKVTLNKREDIDDDAMVYFVDHECSDDVLQYAFDTFRADFDNSLRITHLGLAFCVLVVGFANPVVHNGHKSEEDNGACVPVSVRLLLQ